MRCTPRWRGGIVRMEDRFDTDIDDVWSALTTPGRLARWLGEVDGDLRLNPFYWPPRRPLITPGQSAPNTSGDART
jgi:hypothetical protein